MSIKLFKYTLVISNLLLIALIILGITLSYLFIVPDIVNRLDYPLGVVTAAFALWGVALTLSSVCFIGIVYSRFVCLHFSAALILLLPLALAVWIVVEQFLFKEKVNVVIVAISITASIIWFVQIICELCLGCWICCKPGVFDEEDGEKGGKDGKKCKSPECGSDEEKEKLVIMGNESPGKNQLNEINEANPEEEDEVENEKDYRDSMLTDARDRGRFGHHGLHGHDMDVRPIDEDAETTSPSPESGQGKGPRRTTELPLGAIPEEKQRLLA